MLNILELIMEIVPNYPTSPSCVSTFVCRQPRPPCLPLSPHLISLPLAALRSPLPISHDALTLGRPGQPRELAHRHTQKQRRSQSCPIITRTKPRALHKARSPVPVRRRKACGGGVGGGDHGKISRRRIERIDWLPPVSRTLRRTRRISEPLMDYALVYQKVEGEKAKRPDERTYQRTVALPYYL
jgi:hypothetical protein